MIGWRLRDTRHGLPRSVVLIVVTVAAEASILSFVGAEEFPSFFNLTCLGLFQKFPWWTIRAWQGAD
jgi:hypothetical protein